MVAVSSILIFMSKAAAYLVVENSGVFLILAARQMQPACHCSFLGI